MKTVVAAVAACMLLFTSTGIVGAGTHLGAVVHKRQPATYLEVDFVSDSNGFVTAQKSGSFWLEATKSGGATWTSRKLPFGLAQAASVLGPNPTGAASLQFLTASTGWIEGYNLGGCRKGAPKSPSSCRSAIYATKNQGKTWKQLLSTPLSGQIDEFQLVDPSTGWALTSSCRTSTGGGRTCGYKQRILVTHDFGAKWHAVQWKLGHVAGFGWDSPLSGWAATGPAPGASTCQGTLFRTSDGGVKWWRATHLNGQCAILPSFAGGAGWIASANTTTCQTGGCPDEELRRSDDDGKTWQVEDGSASWTGTAGFVEHAQLVDSDHGFLAFGLGSTVSTQGGVATTLDGGKTWNRSYPCYGVEPGGADMLPSGTVWLAGTWVSYCSQARGTGLFVSSDWGQHWKQAKTGL